MKPTTELRLLPTDHPTRTFHYEADYGPTAERLLTVCSETAHQAWEDIQGVISFADDPRTPRPLAAVCRDLNNYILYGSDAEREASLKYDLMHWLTAWRRAGRPSY